MTAAAARNSKAAVPSNDAVVRSNDGADHDRTAACSILEAYSTLAAAGCRTSHSGSSRKDARRPRSADAQTPFRMQSARRHLGKRIDFRVHPSSDILPNLPRSIDPTMTSGSKASQSDNPPRFPELNYTKHPMIARRMSQTLKFLSFSQLTPWMHRKTLRALPHAPPKGRAQVEPRDLLSAIGANRHARKQMSATRRSVASRGKAQIV